MKFSWVTRCPNYLFAFSKRAQPPKRLDALATADPKLISAVRSANAGWLRCMGLVASSPLLRLERRTHFAAVFSKTDADMARPLAPALENHHIAIRQEGA